jgi:tetratricopeptide (TPR) repeat protein
MDLLGLVVAAGIVTALTLQASSCFFKSERPLSMGALDIILAALVIFLCISLLTGQMVLASEFGTIMVSGMTMTWLLRIALIITALVPALCWYRIRILNGWRLSLAVFVLPAFLIGICAACRVLLLNPSDLPALRVYQYDIWWPPMVAWFVVCFSGSVLALIKARSMLMGVALSAALGVAIAIFALHHQDLADPRCRPVWNILERGSFVTAAIILTKVATESLGKKLRIAICAVAALSASVFAILPDDRRAPGSVNIYIPDGFRTVVSLVPLALLVVGLVVAIVEQLPNLLKPQPADGSVLSPTETQRGYAAKIFRFDRASGFVLSISLPVIGLCVTDLFALGYLNRAIDALVIFTLWMFFAERLAEGALDNLPKLVMNGVLQLTILKRGWSLLVSKLSKVGPSAKSFITFAVGGSESSATAKTFFATLTTIIFAVAALIVLTAIDEVSNYQKTIVKGFHSVAGIDANNDIAAGISSEALINALGRLRRDLRPEILMAQRSSSSEHPMDVRLLKAGADSSSVENAVAKSDELKIGGIAFPVTYFVSPIQHLIRSILGTREINATVQRSSTGSYIVLANSSNGDTWLEFSEVPPKNTTGDNKEATVATAGSALTGASPRYKDDTRAHKCPLWSRHQDIASELIDRLAFDVASSDPAFIAAGLTKNPEAFDYFRAGLRRWQAYERSQDDKESEELKLAAGCFRQAVELDKHFALAFYRLGLAMQRSNKPGAAVDAFRASVASNPEFISAAATEAWTLFDFNAYYATQTAGFPPLAPVASKRDQALKMWATLAALPSSSISLSEKRSAYYGLCSYYISSVQDGDAGPDGNLYYVPYFFCSRARALFTRLTANARQDPDERNLEAVVLSALGVALESHRGQFRYVQPEQLPGAWSCDASAIDPADLKPDGKISRLRLFGSATSHAALRYYQDSLALVPLDEVVRCDEAGASAFTNADMSTMKYLGSDAGAHLAVAQSLINSARESAFEGSPELASGYYHRALGEFDRSADLDPEFIDALNGYGYAYWEWWTNWRRARTSMPPTPEVSYKAEHYAREGLRIAHLRSTAEDHLGFDEMMIEDSLGEVLLAQGRVTEAIEHLRHVATKESTWQGLAETKWDFAQAEICAAQEATKTSEKMDLLQSAMSQFVNIRAAEQDREFQPFTTADDALDPLLWAPTCPSRPDKTEGKEFPFGLQARSYQPGPSCVWSGVVARMSDSTLQNAVYLHLWGGGIDRRISVEPGRQQSILLEAPPKSRAEYFFAQLEDAAGQTLSKVNILDTFENPKNGDCSKNWITLVYAPEQKADTKAATKEVAKGKFHQLTKQNSTYYNVLKQNE